MDNATRERERIALMLGEIANDKDGSKLAACRDLMRAVDAFATSEADRRERECVEAVCSDCEEGHKPVRKSGGPTWRHVDGYLSRRCHAAGIHELRYQRERGGK